MDDGNKSYDARHKYRDTVEYDTYLEKLIFLTLLFIGWFTIEIMMRKETKFNFFFT